MKRFLVLLVLLASPAYSAPLPYYFTHRMPLFDVVGSSSPRGGGGTGSSNLFASGLVLNDDQLINLGTTTGVTRPGIQFNTTQTPDTGMLLTGTVSNHFIIAERQDNTFDFAHAAATDPTLFIHSHNQSTSEWTSLNQNGTAASWDSGPGRWVFGPNGTASLAVNGNGTTTRGNMPIGFVSSSTDAAASAPDALFIRDGAAASIQMGLDANGAIPAQSFKAADGITGTDVKGGNITFASGRGTGAGAAAQLNISRSLMLGTGTSAQSLANAVTICESKTLSNTSATATALANVGLASNTSGAVQFTVSVQCNDGTNFDSDMVTSYVAYVNKATVITVGTPVTTASAAANNSGSCTVAPTIVANGTTSIDIKVTPVITTIVPTTTTGYIEVHNFGAGAVTCQ